MYPLHFDFLGEDGEVRLHLDTGKKVSLPALRKFCFSWLRRARDAGLLDTSVGIITLRGIGPPEAYINAAGWLEGCQKGGYPISLPESLDFLDMLDLDVLAGTEEIPAIHDQLTPMLKRRIGVPISADELEEIYLYRGYSLFDRRMAARRFQASMQGDFDIAPVEHRQLYLDSPLLRMDVQTLLLARIAHGL